MGLKNYSIVADRQTKKVSFTGVKRTRVIVDEQNGNECWIEAIENLIQLYSTTKYNTNVPMSPVLISNLRNAVKNELLADPDRMENEMRDLLVTDLLQNNGQRYGYFIYEDNGAGSKMLITAENASNPQVRAILAQYKGKTRSAFKNADDNLGHYPGMEAMDAYRKLLLDYGKIDTTPYAFDTNVLRAALDQDRPVFLAVDVRGLSHYNGQSGGHALVVVDYEKGSNGFGDIFHIIDSNNPGNKYELAFKISESALKAAYNGHLPYQMLVPNVPTNWNRIMG